MKNIIFLLIIAVAICSCQKEEHTTTQVLQTHNNKEGVVKINSEENLKEIINQMKLSKVFNVRCILRTKASDTEFDESFVSLRENMIESVMMSLSESELSEIQQEELLFEPEDSLITDPYYAAILNDNREIQIGDKVYRYIEEGLLVYDYDPNNPFVPETIEQYPELNEGESCPVFDGNGNQANLYGMCYGTEEDDQTGREGSGNHDFGSSQPDVNNPQPLNDNTLSLLSGVIIPAQDIKSVVYKKGNGSGSWLQKGISACFGTNVTITNHFNSTHRMKLRMFSQDYLIYRSSGLTVRMQKKKFGIWWRKKAEEFVYGWSPIELRFKYNSIKVPFYNPNSQQQDYPTAMSKKFPFSNSNIELFYIPFVDYNVTTGNLNSVYKALVKKLLGIIKGWFKDPNAQENQKHRLGFYTVKDDNEMLVIFPQGEEHSEGHGRDVVRFESGWFEGEYTIGFKIGIDNNSFDFDKANFSNAGTVKIERGKVFASVKYNGIWKACEIYTQ